MHELRVVDISDGKVVAVDDAGQEYRLALDDSQLARLRSMRNEGVIVKVSPREIQALIRAGLSAAEVSRVSGATPEDVERYEAPVVAEREFVLNSALATPSALDVHDTPVPFGVHIRSRLESLAASEQRWASWKDPADGWLVKVEFTAKGIDHDARWAFDPRRGSLVPINADASTLSQQGELNAGLIPRLRAVDVMTGAIPTTNDSGAHSRRIPTSPVFSQVSESIKTGAINIIPSSTGAPTMSIPTANTSELPLASATEVRNPAVAEDRKVDFSDDGSANLRIAAPSERSAEKTPRPVAARDEMVPPALAAIAESENEDQVSTPTADLLEALRKRRQERNVAPSWLTDGRVESTVTPERLVPNPVSEDLFHAVAIEVTESLELPQDTETLDSEPLTETGKQRRARKARPTLPAWDNIVFGKQADEIS